MSDNWIQTYTGLRLDLLDPDPATINLDDIAHALALQCRFNGHCREFYSVAEHSVRVARILPERLRAWGLMHDATEAYIGDIVRPLRRAAGLECLDEIETDVLAAVAVRFGLPLLGDVPFADYEAIRHADDILLATEARDLMAPPPEDWGLTVEPLPDTIEPWGQRQAERSFLWLATSLGLNEPIR